jgi:hypothetical protein
VADTNGEKYVFASVTDMSLEALAEYRQELVNTILNPGVEYEASDDVAEAAYRSQLAVVDARLRELTGSPEGGNL